MTFDAWLLERECRGEYTAIPRAALQDAYKAGRLDAELEPRCIICGHLGGAHRRGVVIPTYPGEIVACCFDCWHSPTDCNRAVHHFALEARPPVECQHAYKVGTGRCTCGHQLYPEDGH